MSYELRMMNTENLTHKPIKTFRDLFAWTEGHKLVLSIYEVTKQFPRSESFALTDQMRRAAVSITSNISEGFSRRGWKEKTQFYSMALGSLTELQNQLVIARDIGYITQSHAISLNTQSVTVHKLLNGLIKATRQTSTPNS